MVASHGEQVWIWMGKRDHVALRYRCQLWTGAVRQRRYGWGMESWYVEVSLCTHGFAMEWGQIMVCSCTISEEELRNKLAKSR